MEAVGLLPQSQILQEWWQEVKDNFWQEDAKRSVKELLKELMESTMIKEIAQKTGVGYYKHAKAKREDYRNGYYNRALVTQFGIIQDIKTPRLRKGPFKTKVFRRYKRHQEIVEDLIEDIFLAGVSTRRVGEAISKLLDIKVSHGTVSNITKRLDKKVKEFHNSPILDEYQYLFCDGITLKMRYNGKYHNRKVLTAYGITLFGQRKLLGFVQSQGESQNSWEGLINSLYRRGLKGGNLKLVTIDGSGGLKSALQIVYPHVPIQRCWAHKLRNVSNYLKKLYQEDCINDARRIYRAKSKHLAMAEFKNWKKMWKKKAPKAAHCLEKDLEELLNFFDSPKNHWIRVRTTNVIERCFKEVRRRTRVFSCFSNRQSCERIIYAIFAYLNNKWKDCPIKQFTQFC
jgi:putative transposase